MTRSPVRLVCAAVVFCLLVVPASFALPQRPREDGGSVVLKVQERFDEASRAVRSVIQRLLRVGVLDDFMAPPKP